MTVQITYLALVLTILWGLFLSRRLQLCFLHVALVFLSVQLISVFVHCLLHSNYYPFALLSLGLFAFVAGLIATQLYLIPAKRYVSDILIVRHYPRTDLYLFYFAFFSILFCVVYHYLVGGIPILSEDLIQERFQQDRSGLFGIPGRITMYGPVFMIFLASAYSQMVANRSARIKTFLVWSYALAALSLIPNGDKSSLIVVMQVFIVAKTYYTNPRFQERINYKILALFGCMAVLIVILVAGLQMQSKSEPKGLNEFLFVRIFYLSGWPFYHTIEHFIPKFGNGWGEYLLRDANYLLGVVGLGSGDLMNTSMLLSADMRGVALSSDTFVVAVTNTVFGQLYMDFGVSGIALGGFLFGCLAMILFDVGRMTRSIYLRALVYFAQYLMIIVATKGNAVYAMGSTSFALVFILGIIIVAKLVIKSMLHVRPRNTVRGEMTRPLPGIILLLIFLNLLMTTSDTFANVLEVGPASALNGLGADVEDIKQALKKLKTRRDIDTLVIGPGIYRFSRQGPKAHLLIEGLTDKTIVGKGTTFLFSRPNRSGIDIRRCHNLTIKGITIGWEPEPYIQGHIISVNRLTRSITLTMEETTVKNAVDQFGLTSKTWASLHHPDGQRLHGISHEVLHVAAVKRINGRQVTVILRDMSDVLRPRLKKGTHMVVVARQAGGHGIGLRDSSHISIAKMAVFNAPAMGILVHPGNKDITIVNNRIKPFWEKGAFVATNADGIHVIDPAGKLTIAGNIINATQDDAIVVSRRGLPAMVRRQPSQIVIPTTHPSVRFASGRKLMGLIDEGDLVPVGIIQAVQKEQNNGLALDLRWTTTADRLTGHRLLAFPLPTDPGTIEIRGNMIEAVRGIGIRINANAVDVTQNRIVETTGPMIRMAYFLEGRWLPQYPAQDVRIKGNHLMGFKHAQDRRHDFGMIDIGCIAQQSTCSAGSRINRKIRITGNRFKCSSGFAASAVRLRYADNVLIAQNSGETVAGFEAGWPISKDNCRAIVERDNVNFIFVD